MKFFRFVLTFITCLTTFAVSACGGSPQDRAKTNEESDRQQKDEKSIYISEETLDEIMKSGDDFFLIDVRETYEFAGGHIEDAYNIPLGVIGTEVTKRISDIKKNDEIILYCRTNNRSTRAYTLLSALGYTNVRVMQGGWPGWARYISGR